MTQENIMMGSTYEPTPAVKIPAQDEPVVWSTAEDQRKRIHADYEKAYADYKLACSSLEQANNKHKIALEALKKQAAELRNVLDKDMQSCKT